MCLYFKKWDREGEVTFCLFTWLVYLVEYALVCSKSVSKNAYFTSKLKIMCCQFIILVKVKTVIIVFFFFFVFFSPPKFTSLNVIKRNKGLESTVSIIVKLDLRVLLLIHANRYDY